MNNNATPTTEAERAGFQNGFVGHDEAGRFVHYCHCGKYGSFGVGVSLTSGKLGQWYCAEHRPPQGELETTKPRAVVKRPDLQELVARFGGYNKITPGAWAEYDDAMAEYRKDMTCSNPNDGQTPDQTVTGAGQQTERERERGIK